jgi:proteic killer suppression protein
MISNIKDRTTQDIFDGVNSKAARILDPKLHQRARDLLDALNAITDPSDLKTPPSNRLHKLKHDLKEYWSISINDKWRIIFKWEKGMAIDVEITDYH